MLPRIIFAFLFAINIFAANAFEKRDLLEKNVDMAKLKSSLLINQQWVAYPKYSDRKGWDALTVGVKDEIIKKGEAALNFEWKVVKATDYLEFDLSGSRKIMEDPYRANINAISDLVLAELAEGKGRFTNQIANGIWYFCEMTSWSLSAHIKGAQPESTSLPSYKENIIDLGSSDMGAFFAWTYFFLKDELDKVQPMISERLRANIQTRIMDSYLNRSDFWWQAFNAGPTTMVNNWNPWCNSSVLMCFLLLENDPEKLAAAVYRTMVSTDKFINYYNNDGACEEGPSYWSHAPGKLYDYLQLLSYATAGKVTIFNQPLIRNMGEYIAKSYIGNGWMVNFADAWAKAKVEKGVVFRYGKAVNSLEMQQFASYLYEFDKNESYFDAGRDLFRTFENLTSHNELLQTKPSVSDAPATWYPETEVCYMRNKVGIFVAAKGGNNAESHNHNDVGSFLLYVDYKPMIIDAGVGVYTRQTFSSERYNIWNMQSNYHNLPLVNGVAQSDGAKFRSRNATFDTKKSLFSLDIANTYSKEAAVNEWHRTFQLQPKGGLLVQDAFKMSKTKSPNQLNYLTWSKPDILEKGVITLEKDGSKLKISYNPNQLEAVVETIHITDRSLLSVWGETIYRLTLKAKKMKLVDNYSVQFSRF
jgi:hypothetical protein